MQVKKINKSSASKWEEAIQDARQKLMEGKLYVARIKAAIKLFESQKSNGAPWPTQSRDQKPEQQHSV